MRKVGAYKRKLNDQEMKLVKDLYREGWNLRQLAEYFNVSRQAIWYLLKTRGVETRPRHPKHANYTNGKGVNTERDEAGINVTLREQESGRLLSLHVPGKRIDALRYVAGAIDKAALDWRIFCYSTPETILGELQGKRTAFDCLEAQVLGRIGRRDLLDPKLDIGYGEK